MYFLYFNTCLYSWECFALWSYQTNQRYDTEWIIGYVSLCNSYQVQKAPFTYGNLIWDQSSYARAEGCVEKWPYEKSIGIYGGNQCKNQTKSELPKLPIYVWLCFYFLRIPTLFMHAKLLYRRQIKYKLSPKISIYQFIVDSRK